MPQRKVNPNNLVRNNLSASKVDKRPFSARNAKNENRTNLDRPGMVYTGIFISIIFLILLVVCFLITHFETNRHLKEITTNIDRSREDFLNLTRHLMSEDFRIGSIARPNSHRIDHAQFSLGAKVIKLQAVELPVNGPVRNFLGMTVPKSACNILGRYLDRRNFLVFKGDKAIITIRLHQPVFPDTIRIDHYIENLRDYKLVNAVPKDVAVYGIRLKTADPVPLGQMRMNLNLHSKSQAGIMHVKQTEAYEVYKIEILSNHGNADFTRLYKVRIYGRIGQNNVL